MASRNSLEKAQALKTEMEAQHPAATFKIIDQSATRRMGRLVAESNGFEVVADTGGIMVVVKESRFNVLEVRECQDCKVEILTSAIGELTVDRCESCRQNSDEKFGVELAKSVKQEKARTDELETRNRFEE